MNKVALKVFHALPGPLRSVAASVRGYQLRRWRYGPQTDQWAAEARERETWTPGQWKQWQEERLARLLHRAATKVPYYRDYWAERRRRGDPASWEQWENWPLLTKEILRRNAAAFVAEDCGRRKMVHETTSGTTGTPLSLWQRREVSQYWYALWELRCRTWYGISRHDRWGIVGAQKVAAPGTKTPPFWVWNAGLHQLYLSAMHLAPWSVDAYLKAITQYRLRYLLGYTNSLVFLAQAAKASGQKSSLAVIVTNGEPLSSHQRDLIQDGFQCPVRESYGMAEIACAASECEAGQLHVWPEAGVLEILDEQNQPLAAGNAGRLIATGLANTDMILVRYDTRDMGSWSADPTPCACGRRLPRLGKVIGRADDVIVTRDGRRLVQFDGFLSANPRVREAQIVQKTSDAFVLRVVPEPTWTEADAQSLCDGLRHYVGDCQVCVETVPHLERTWAGKFRVIVSEAGPPT